jgi:hypothetical protein
MKTTLLGIMGGIAVAIVTSPASATTLTGFSTLGSGMSGMEITVNFFDGTTQTSVWNATSGLGGGAFGNSWSLTQSGNTFGYFGNNWVFSSGGESRVAALIIDAIPGNTVFDNVPVNELTPGSADGWNFQLTSGLAPSRHEYSAAIDISQGDLFGRLSLFWDDGFTGAMSFLADTDSGTANDPVTPRDPLPPLPAPPVPPEPVRVPEPAAVLGLLTFAGASTTLLQKQSA